MNEHKNKATTEDLAAAERIAGVEYTSHERELLSGLVLEEVASLHERIAALVSANGDHPAVVFRVGGDLPTRRQGEDIVLPSMADRRDWAIPPVPPDDEGIAFAAAWMQAAWMRAGSIAPADLVELYRSRLERHGQSLLCLAHPTWERAAREAAEAAGRISAGEDGPLLGLVWGAKDLFDTAGIPTTWGAEPYRDRVPGSDAGVVRRLSDAGCALVAKLSLGALAYGDIWYEGRTRNPWKPDRGSSGSSAGSAAATAAGLVSFALGTETLGSIVSPSMECGTTGLRPTFGRVGRSGAMALSWSFDKVGPICRTVRDCGLVLEATAGFDPGDPSSIDAPFAYAPRRDLSSLRVGYDPRWFDTEPAGDLDRSIPAVLEELGVGLVSVSLPEYDYPLLATLLQVDAAAAFEELTRSNRDDELSWQSAEAWPNIFRAMRFVSAVEYVQLERFRRRVCDMMEEVYADVDIILAPSFSGPMLYITNATGHPSLTLRIGFKESGLPHGITMYGRLFGENSLLGVGEALEARLAVWDKRPPL